MTRTTFLAAALALSACGLGAAHAQVQSPAQAQAQMASAAAVTMQPGQRMQLAGAMANRIVRNIMISPDGGSIDVIFDMPAGAPQSQRVLRLENVNGMLEVIYDTAMPRSMPLANGGTPRLIPNGHGMYDVTYDR